MASITLNFDYSWMGYGYYGYYKLDFWESGVDHKNNQSTVSYTITADRGDGFWYDFYLYVSINGERIWSGSGGWNYGKFPAADGSYSGSITVKHDSNGTKSISAYMEGYRYVYTALSGSNTLALTNIKTNKITYNANGGNSTPAEQIKIADNTINLAGAISRSNSDYSVTTTFNGNGDGASSPAPAKTTVNRSYSFGGWKDSDGVVYAAGASYSANKDITLTAIWNESISGNKVTFPAISRPGYSFTGWSLTPGGSIIDTDNYRPTSDSTVYANWIAEEYTVYYNGNGAIEGSMPSSTFVYDKKYRLSTNIFKNGLFDFMGWATTSFGGVKYTDGETVSKLTTEESITLYAVWGDSKPAEISNFYVTPSAQSIMIFASANVNYDSVCYYSINGGSFTEMSTNVKYQQYNNTIIVDGFKISGLTQETEYNIVIKFVKKSTGAETISNAFNVKTTYFAKLTKVLASENLVDGIGVNYDVATTCNIIRYRLEEAEKEGTEFVRYGTMPSTSTGTKFFKISDEDILDDILACCHYKSNKFKLSIDFPDSVDEEWPDPFQGESKEFLINFNDETATDKIRPKLNEFFLSEDDEKIKTLTLSEENENIKPITYGLTPLTFINKKGENTSILQVKIYEEGVETISGANITNILLYDKNEHSFSMEVLEDSEEDEGKVHLFYYNQGVVGPDKLNLLVGKKYKLTVKLKDERGITSNGIEQEILVLSYTEPKIKSVIFNRELDELGLSVNLKCDFFSVPRNDNEPLRGGEELPYSTKLSPNMYSNNNYIKSLYIGFSPTNLEDEKLDRLTSKIAYQSIPIGSFTGNLSLNAENIDTTVSPDMGYVIYVIITDYLGGTCLYSNSITRLVPIFNKQKGIIKDERNKDMPIDRYSFNTKEVINSTFFYKTEEDEYGFVIDDTDMRINKEQFDILCDFLYSALSSKPSDWDTDKTTKYYKKIDTYYYFCEPDDEWGEQIYYEVKTSV